MTTKHVCAYLCKDCGNAGRPAAIERLEKERDAVWEATQRLQPKLDRAAEQTLAMRERLIQAEAQRDEAVAFREWVAEYAKVWRKEEYGPTGEDLRHFVKQLHTKLAGLSTVTPKVDVIYITRDQTERRGQVCERVSVCCDLPDSADCSKGRDEHEGFKCATHYCPWPVEGECPTKERPLGRPPRSLMTMRPRPAGEERRPPP